MRIVSIVGARPQFVKMAAICRAVRTGVSGVNLSHRIIHTGQHYDWNMSQVFFEEMDIPAPDYNLDVGSGPHGIQTGEMMKRLEPVLAGEQPDWVLLYGDTNSTAAGALVAAKLNLKLAHVEAGLRTFKRNIPEEQNRIVTDHLSDLLLCPTPLAMENLKREGLADRAVFTGDVMYDAALAFRSIAENRGGPLAERWKPGAYALATLHRPVNTDDPQRLRSMMQTLDRLAREVCPVVMPLHPRAQKMLASMNWTPAALVIIAPASYLDMLLLESRARFIVTDSGGVQKEAYFASVPCVTMLHVTEWRETLENHCNVLAGPEEESILRAVANTATAGPWTAVYGDGNAAGKTLQALCGCMV